MVAEDGISTSRPSPRSDAPYVPAIGAASTYARVSRVGSVEDMRTFCNDGSVRDALVWRICRYTGAAT